MTKFNHAGAALTAHKSGSPSGAGGETGNHGRAQTERGASGAVVSADLVGASRSVPSQAEMRSKILALEAVMREMKGHHVELPVTHHFAPGIYMRELFIPKGVTLTGKIHKTEHLNILSQGVLRVMTEDGMKTLTASTVVKSQPGIKRAGYAIEDSVWITVHHNPDECRDPDLLVERLTVETFEQLPGFSETQQIEGEK